MRNVIFNFEFIGKRLQGDVAVGGWQLVDQRTHYDYSAYNLTSQRTYRKRISRPEIEDCGHPAELDDTWVLVSEHIDGEISPIGSADLPIFSGYVEYTRIYESAGSI